MTTASSHREPETASSYFIRTSKTVTQSSFRYDKLVAFIKGQAGLTVLSDHIRSQVLDVQQDCRTHTLL